MAKKKISDYLPPKSTDDFNYLQAKVPRELYGRVKEKMKAKKYTWDQLVEACFRHYLEEEK